MSESDSRSDRENATAEARPGRVSEDEISIEGLHSIVDGFARCRVFVLGDLMLDEYRRGEVERVSPEAPVSIVRVAEITQQPGGAGNVARNLRSLGAECVLGGVLGDDAEGAAFRKGLAAEGVDLAGVMTTTTRPTTHKQRIVVRDQQMLRLDREERGELDPQDRQALREWVDRDLAGSDVVILEDYDKGVFAGGPRNGLAAYVIERARECRIPVVADPKTNLERFRGASIVKPNLDEALLFSASTADSFRERRAMLEKLCEAIGGGDIVVTRGGEGMSALERNGRMSEIPTKKLAVYDVQGAGDTAVAALALARAVGATLVEACIVANAAGSVAVEKFGTASVSIVELRARLAESWTAWRGDESSGRPNE